MKRVKILHISRQFYPCVGGTERYIYEIAKRLVKRNIKCRVLTLNYNVFNRSQKFKNFETIEGIEVFRINSFGHYKKPIPLSLPLELFKWANIVHLHDVRFLFETSIILKKLFKYKIVYSTHGFIYHTSNLSSIKKILTLIYYKPIFSKIVDAIISVSRQDYSYFKNFSENVFLIENGIEYNKFSNIIIKPIKGEFLYFGRIDTNKGLDLLFHILAKLKDIKWQLNIVGSGFPDLIYDFKRLAKELGIDNRIIWWGFLPEEKLLELISKSEICFFPSTYEGFGFTLIEAMASGCVCIANNIPTYRDIIDNNIDGFIVDFKNSKIAAEKIKQIINLPQEKFKKISQQAKFKAKRYDWEEKIEQIVKVYEYTK